MDSLVNFAIPGITIALIIYGLIKLSFLGKTLHSIEIRNAEYSNSFHTLKTELTNTVQAIEQEVSNLKRDMLEQLAQHKQAQQAQLFQLEKQLLKNFSDFKDSLNQYNAEQQSQHHQRHQQQLKSLHDSLMSGLTELRKQLDDTLKLNTESLNKTIEKLINNTDTRLKEISQEVDKRLTDGFEKTTQTFTDIVKRLAIIDEAQKKITELSSNVVSLQDILADKRSRGAFGEVQLNSLIRNVLPEQHFAFQYTLPNDKRVDCLLFLPKPTGNVPIDAKFPLENYHKMTDHHNTEPERKSARQKFVQDIKKHITDIAQKYIIPGETSDGALMFIPAESVFAELHANYPELIEFAHKSKVWVASPTTLVAILTTARSVIKDEATKQQIHIIQEHLGFLAKDFSRFEKRMDNLARHINQAQQDVNDVNTSAKKIAQRFHKIEKVELNSQEKLEVEVEA